MDSYGSVYQGIREDSVRSVDNTSAEREDPECDENFSTGGFPLVREKSVEEITAGFGNFNQKDVEAEPNQTIVKVPEQRSWNQVTMFTLSHRYSQYELRNSYSFELDQNYPTTNYHIRNSRQPN